ncbi:MAG TPA: hypothetical protein PKA55_07650 [Rhodoblastus sp.]|nr:hypothetical protein [Rhodoblastus sp.]
MQLPPTFWLGLGSFCYHPRIWADHGTFFAGLQLNRFFSALILLTIASPVAATGECKVSADKKAIIRKLLCGGFAPEKEYQKLGPDCGRLSAAERMKDSAIQIISYRACGYTDFAARLQDANQRTAAFFDLLATCAENPYKVTEILQEKLRSTQMMISSRDCTSDLLSTLNTRRAFFEQMIQQVSKPELEQENLLRFRIKKTEKGDLVDVD